MRFIRSRSASFVQYLLITSSLSTPNSVLNRSACFLKQHRHLSAGTPMSATASGAMSLPSECKTITELSFDNRNIQHLPIDTNEVKSVRQVSNAIFSLVEPMPVKSPKLLAYSKSVFEELLGLRVPVDNNDENILSEYFGGNKIIPGSRPAAHCYCGHQFGNFAGQLGDGATMYLGEVINAKSGKRWELQLKGAGKTPYSRTADGRKVLRSSVREFLCSEAMHFLGVPTTRAGSCVTSDSTVQRDPMYDGGVIDERCTIVSRIASNFFRFGSFEIFKPMADDGDYDGRAGPSAGNSALKQQLLDHILLYYPEITNTQAAGSATAAKHYEHLYAEIVRRTAFLVARWQAVGFVHGVLNTDNMSIMGLTIDYGPFGFLEHYDPQYVPNGSDNSARYSYQEQPAVCAWNLGKLAEVLEPLLSESAAQSALQRYDGLYEGYYQAMMGAKFGFLAEGVATTGGSDDEVVPVGEGRILDPGDHALVGGFFEALAATSADFTDAFVALTDFVAQLEQADLAADLDSLVSSLALKLVSRSASPSSLVQASRRKMRIHRLSMHPAQIEQIHSLLQSAPPAQLSRMFNGAPVDAIREEINGEKRKLDLLVQSAGTVKKYEAMGPAAKQAQDKEVWAMWCAKYAVRMAEIVTENRATVTDGTSIAAHSRSSVMRAHNPTFVLRSWLAQDAIKMAEDNADYSGINTLLDMLQKPYAPEYSTFLNESACSTSQTEKESAVDSKATKSSSSELQRKYTSVSPEWADSLICTCSS